MSRVLDKLLPCARASAAEALQFGLINRLVKSGELMSEAEKLALQIAAFPQTCMRNDRRSAYEQLGMSESDAIRNEFKLGLGQPASAMARVGTA